MTKRIIVLMATAMSALCMYAQNTLKATVKEEDSGEPLVGVTVKIDGTACRA